MEKEPSEASSSLRCGKTYKTVHPLETGNIRGTSGYRQQLGQAASEGDDFQRQRFAFITFWRRQIYVTSRQQTEECFLKSPDHLFWTLFFSVICSWNSLLSKGQCLLLIHLRMSGEEKNGKNTLSWWKERKILMIFRKPEIYRSGTCFI